MSGGCDGGPPGHRRSLHLGLSLVLVVALGACLPEDLEPVDPPGPFWLGVNYPWHHYGHDFGAAWSHDGVSTAPSRSQVASDLQAIAADGLRVVRWFVFADGRAAPEHDAMLQVGEVAPEVWADLDAALAEAEAANLHLLPVLFDYLWFAAASEVGGVELGGHGNMILDPALRQRLREQLVRPLLQRYGNHPNILAWELCNEPEWAIQGDRASVAGAVPLATMQAWVAELAAEVHAHSERPVTLGSASLEAMLAYWADSDLDLLQFHHYLAEPLGPAVTELGVDRPVLIGELPTRDSFEPLSVSLDRALALGYQGLLPWSYAADDHASDYAGVRDQLVAWAVAHRDELLPLPR